MKSAAPAVRVADLHKSYRSCGERIPALDGVTLQIERGSITGLLGPNGSGKSTLMHCMLGLVRPEQGSIEIFGIPAAVARSRRHVGFLPEEVTYEAGLRVGEVLDLQLRLACEGSTCGAVEALSAVGLALPRRRRISHCSQGMLRRLALACALIGAPQLLVLDEPTSGMDLASRDRLIAFLQRLKEQGRTVLISSHLFSELQQCCDRYVILRAGRVVKTAGLEPRLRMVIHGVAYRQALLMLGPAWTISKAGQGLVAETVDTAAELTKMVAAVEDLGGTVSSLTRDSGLEESYRKEIEP